MSTATKQTLAIGGITVHVYSQPNATDPATPVTVLFLLHGRKRTVKDCEWIAESTLKWTQEQRKASRNQAQDLLIVTFGLRNHGSRVVDRHANNGWKKEASENNARYAVDMYAIIAGTSRDISFLIDFLPSYLYPSGDRTIAQWLVGGLSLGGHTTWYTLRNEPRVVIGIVIAGCPAYLKMMAERAKEMGIPFTPPHIPKSLLHFIQAHDAAAAPYMSSGSSNPFLGKKVLALAGTADKSVPWAASRGFVENLNVGEGGVKQVFIQPGVGHECTGEMVKVMSKFIWEQALAV
ncbi:uncharacterized protein LAESUDRAFT_402371 [Laetiporus sulphureus 93-53]|uniref:Alpha/beta-hydrolase n=1 Tax=Laetiporus sulphureus 93-53 TaxID=1314785 RepID=A0A165CC40_9APHY|nr:uncharacterized protein LAESUDRAFT_402371 [Laetiporus sulphureus 93-53]KZT02543.1 hypothetical protein LAESUDRAFT_402371 [Laetiporus sulphureus 93-53]